MATIQTTGGELTDEIQSTILANIRNVFGCKPEDIKDFAPLQKGLTNIVVIFRYKGGKYIYRHPGLGSEILVSRSRETIMQSIVSQAGIDPSLVAMEASEGWRISRFIDHYPFDYGNLNHMVRAIMLLRNLHELPCKVRWRFDVIEQAERIRDTIPEEHYGTFPEFSEIRDRCYRLYDLVKDDGTPQCYTHGDCRDDNFLINDEEIALIDWEYGGFGDPGFDIGSYVCGGDHTQEDVDRILFTYFRKKPTPAQKRHFYAYIAITGWFFMHWVMLKESKGQAVGILKKRWYRYASEFSITALEMFEGGE